MREDQHSIEAAQSRADGVGGVQGERTVGEVEGGYEHDAIRGLARPNTVVVPSVAYSGEEAERISTLRQERWALLGHFHEMSGRYRYSHTAAYKHKQLRLDVVSEELYQLTGNPIYRVSR